MNIKSHVIPGKKITVIEPTGRFDAHYEIAMKKQIKEALETSPQIVVNLASVHFIDSTALATLVQGMKHARQKNGDLHLVGLQQPVRIIFELTRLDKAFKISTEVDEAVADFS
jgi:anti-sigma B factor antagonist